MVGLKNTDAEQLLQKDIQTRWGTEGTENLAGAAGKDVSATENCMPKGTESRKGMAGSRNCSVFHMQDTKEGVSGNKTAKLDRNQMTKG